jgi:hypothetical protein
MAVAVPTRTWQPPLFGTITGLGLAKELPPLLSNPDCGNSTTDRKHRPERQMAEHNEVAYTTADGNDYPAHEQTYEGFIMLVKYGTAAVIFIVAMMAIFLT